VKVKLLHPVNADSGRVFPAGTLVDVDPDMGDSAEEVLRAAEFELGYVCVVLPDGEDRRLEPDAVDLLALL
jgi:hypothetical protein